MPEKILRLNAVTEMTGLSRSGIYARIAENDFPRQIRLGKRAVGWPLTEIQAWLNQQIEQSRKQP